MEPANDGLLGYITGTSVCTFFMRSVLATVQDPRGRFADVYTTISGPQLAGPRNQVAHYFMEQTDKKWLMLLDSDAVFKPGDVYRLAETGEQRDLLSIGGVMYNANAIQGEWASPFLFADKKDGKYETIWDVPEDAVIPVAVGAIGFTMVNREVFKRIPYPWFEMLGVEGEDVAFFEKMRYFDIQPYVDTSVQVGHQKTAIIDKKWYKERTLAGA